MMMVLIMIINDSNLYFYLFLSFCALSFYASSIYLSIIPSIYRSVFLFIYLSIDRSSFLSFYVCICMSSIYLSPVYLYVYLPSISFGVGGMCRGTSICYAMQVQQLPAPLTRAFHKGCCAGSHDYSAAANYVRLVRQLAKEGATDPNHWCAVSAEMVEMTTLAALPLQHHA